MQELLKKAITEFIHKDLPEVQYRDIDIHLNTDQVVLIKGPRKSGKTCLLYSLIHRLRKVHPRETLVYFNTEDERNYPFDKLLLDKIAPLYYESYPESANTLVYFFIDGALNFNNWPSFAKKIADQYNSRLIMTGNTKNNPELENELKAKIAVYELFPLSFREYLEIRKTGLNLSSSLELARIKHIFANYISGSAFPEYVNMQKAFQNIALQDYANLVIFKDLMMKHNVKNHQLVKYILKYLIDNSGNLLSINNLFKDLKQKGITLARNTPYEYIDFLEDSYLFFTVPILTHNDRLRNRNQRKIYCVDAGLLNSLSTRHQTSKIYENLVFIELRRRYKEVYYWKFHNELDFCITQNGRTELLSVLYSLENKQMLKKKISGLIEGMEFFGNDKSILINDEVDEKIQRDDKEIHVVPLWKWLMEEDKFELIF